MYDLSARWPRTAWHNATIACLHQEAATHSKLLRQLPRPELNVARALWFSWPATLAGPRPSYFSDTRRLAEGLRLYQLSFWIRAHCGFLRKMCIMRLSRLYVRTPHISSIERISNKFDTEDFVPNVEELIWFYSYQFNKTTLCPSMEHSHSCEANRSSPSPEIPHIL